MPRGRWRRSRIAAIPEFSSTIQLPEKKMPSKKSSGSRTGRPSRSKTLGDGTDMSERAKGSSTCGETSSQTAHEISFTVPGPPKGKERPRFNRSTGRTYTPKSTRVYEDSVCASYQQAAPKGLEKDGIWSATLRIYFADLRRRDLDNILKALLDGLEKGSVFRDDSQVKHIDARMLNPVEGGLVHLTVSVIEP